MRAAAQDPASRLDVRYPVIFRASSYSSANTWRGGAAILSTAFDNTSGTLVRHRGITFQVAQIPLSFGVAVSRSAHVHIALLEIAGIKGHDASGRMHLKQVKGCRLLDGFHHDRRLEALDITQGRELCDKKRLVFVQITGHNLEDIIPIAGDEETFKNVGQL